MGNIIECCIFNDKTENMIIKQEEEEMKNILLQIEPEDDFDKLKEFEVIIL
jgi:hypothetical protein